VRVPDRPGLGVGLDASAPLWAGAALVEAA
jgi:hypothetical protein